ncbi:MAG: hypothetical protein LBQ81_04145, partial [Zoogloeaceae bacterium]|jgi:hypothetical protein|nr:hypothetical protein [Zoogloeaceae bacterium]
VRLERHLFHAKPAQIDGDRAVCQQSDLPHGGRFSPPRMILYDNNMHAIALIKTGFTCPREII